jgi:hypothetical protein
MRMFLLAVAAIIALIGPAHAQYRPFTDAVVVVPSDSTTISATRALWIGGPTFGTATTITVLMAGTGATFVQFTVLPGTLLPLSVKQVRATGTTATNIVALR